MHCDSGLRHHVRRGMADNFQPFWVSTGDDAQFGVVLDQVAGIAQHTIDFARQGGLGKARADIGRNVHHRHCVIKLSLASVR